MADTLTLEDKIARVRTDIARELPNSNPFDAGVLNALAVAVGGMSEELSLELQQLLNDIFPLTATGPSLDSWASIKGLVRFSPKIATGSIVVLGVDASPIGSGVEFSSDAGNFYTTTALTTIQESIAVIASLTRIGGVVTAITAVDHSFASGQELTVSGADQSEYNGTFQITVLSVTSFTYDINTTPTTPATGAPIEASAFMSVVPVSSNDSGADQNLISGSELSLVISNPNLSDPAFVGLSGIEGGTNVESDEDFRTRFLNAFAEIPSPFSKTNIIEVTQSISEVTRVLVKVATPTAGKVTVLFTTDFSTSPIPDMAKINEVKADLVAIADITMADPDNDIVVTAPTPIIVNFEFLTLTPNTQGMKNALKSNLAAYFVDGIPIEGTAFKNQYETVIFNTIDPVSGEVLASFVLTTPTIDIVPAINQVLVLGAVSFDV